MNWQALLRGEAAMTVNIVLGMVIGDIVFRLGLAERLMKVFLPTLRRVGIGPVLGTAMTVSMGSSKAGAALLARAVEEGRMSREGAIWGTLSLSFPAYLRRWPQTLVLCAGMTGTAGIVFAVTLLLRSLGRFLYAVFRARGSEKDTMAAEDAAARKPHHGLGWYKRLFKTLPVAWAFYAAAFLVMPHIERLLREHLAGDLLPVAGWGVASAAIAGISASLALARGALEAGELGTAQTVFALLLGNGLGYFTRVLRQNAGYFFGIFPAGMSKSILVRNIATMTPFVLASLAVSALFIVV